MYRVTIIPWGKLPYGCLYSRQRRLQDELPLYFSVTLHRRSMISSLLGKLSWENGKSYEVSTGVHTMISKRAVKYRPYLSINTSTRKILGIDVSAEYIAGKSVTIGLDIRKIMKKTIKMFCRYIVCV